MTSQVVSRKARQTIASTLAGALAFAAVAPAAWSQAYPSKPLTAVVTLPAGSTIDVLARAFSLQVESRLKQPMVVDNKPGAGLMLGMQVVQAAPADGYSMAFTPATPLTIQPHRTKKLPYAADGFIPVCQTFENTFMVAVPASSPYRDFKSFLAEAKASPGKLRYGHSGTGSTPHLMAAELWRDLGVNLSDIPYRGETAYLPGLIAGDIEAGIVTSSLAQQQKLRPLLVFSKERSKWFPDVPTTTDLGYDIPPAGYGGIFVRTGTPQAVVEKLESTCRDVVNSPAYQAVADSLLQSATYLDRKAFSARIADESKSKAKLLSVLNLPE
ncbi:MAG: tripartite tricarboxylate transporter substrate binding protein [Polaromonas sp.]|nr:tripartite tricarboxylate transporter substrate binding protein [Polaromonas sp.]